MYNCEYTIIIETSEIVKKKKKKKNISTLMTTLFDGKEALGIEIGRCFVSLIMMYNVRP
jgi:hypothetical protein